MKSPKNTFFARHWPAIVVAVIAFVLGIAVATPSQSSTQQNEQPQNARTSATSKPQNDNTGTSKKTDQSKAPKGSAETSAYDACTQATEDLQVAVEDMTSSLENRAIVGKTIHVVDLSKDVWNDFIDASAPYLAQTDYNCAASDSTTTLHKTAQSARKETEKVKKHQKTFEQALEKARNYIADNPPSNSASRETLEYRIAWAKEMSKTFKGHMSNEYALTVLERVIVSTRSDLNSSDLDDQTIQGDAQDLLQAIDGVQAEVNAKRISDEHWHYGF